VTQAGSEDSKLRVATAFNLVVDATTAEVVDALRCVDVTCVVLKGPALTDWLYGTDSGRYSVDVDLLVNPATIATVGDVLTGLGYTSVVPEGRPRDRPLYASVWHRGLSSPNVDLHTTIAGIRLPRQETWGVLSRRTEATEVGRTSVEVLDPGAQALHLALHAAKHGVRHDRSLRDLERGIEVLAFEVWVNAAALALELDAVPAFATGLLLVPAGESLLGELGVASTATVDSALRAQTPPSLSLGLAHLAELPTLREKAAFVGGRVFPPPAFMRRWHSLARRGRLGLAAAYVYRPVWFALKLGPAVAAWRRAKKASEASPGR
jgi:Uncharacterised nucleotidyltransferase